MSDDDYTRGSDWFDCPTCARIERQHAQQCTEHVAAAAELRGDRKAGA